jgi:hypothetical protein
MAKATNVRGAIEYEEGVALTVLLHDSRTLLVIEVQTTAMMPGRHGEQSR